MIYIGKHLLSLAMRTKGAKLCSLDGRLVGNGIVPKIGLSEITTEGEEIFEEVGNKLLSKALDDSIYRNAIISNINCEKEVEGWFNGKEFIPPSAHHLKKGNVTITNLVNEVDLKLLKLEGFFKANGYKGPISLGRNKLRVGLNLDGTFTFFEGLNENVGEWIMQVYKGFRPSYKFYSDCVVGYRLKGNRGAKVEVPNEKHFWPLALRKAKEGYIVAEDENIGVITAHGRTLREAMRRIKRTLFRVRIDGKEVKADGLQSDNSY